MRKRNQWSVIALLGGVFGAITVAPTCIQAQTATPSGLQGIVTGSTNETIVEDPVAEAQENKACELRDQGRDLYAKGKLPEAAKAFEQALHLSPVTSGLFPELADIYRRTGRTQDELNLYDFQVNRWKDKRPKTLLTYALLLTRAKRSQEAALAYHGALMVMPRNAELAVPLQKRFDASSFIPTLRLEAAIETGLGMLDYSQGYFGKSSPHLRRAAVLYPNFATAQYYLGAALRQSPDENDQVAGEKVLQNALKTGSPDIRAAVKKLYAGA